MFKENGRLEPADQKEYADSLTKKFVCWKCGYEKSSKKNDFVNSRCPKCLIGDLVEKIDV